MIPKKYPEVLDIAIVDEAFGDKHHIYKIFLGVETEDLKKLNRNEVRDYVKQISKYILDYNENIEYIHFWNIEKKTEL